MNKQSPEKSNLETQNVPGPTVRFGQQQLGYRAVLGIFGTIAALLLALAASLSTIFSVGPQPRVADRHHVEQPVFMAETHDATDYLINQLKSNGLWKIPPSLEVPRFFIESYPPDLYSVDDISTKKKVFLHSLLPHALLVREEALRKRDRLESILGKIDCSLEDINFDAGYDAIEECSWSDFLAEDETTFIRNLCTNYRATSAVELLKRVDAVPTSIILAQGALESSWGSSRFTREGNSIFGMWTWKTKGMVPSRRDEGKTHKVKVYESVLDSVRAYHLTLNRLDSYGEFRQLRSHTDDPLILAEGLTLYSERGEEYVEDIKKVILSNNLQKYDNCSLTDIEQMTQFTGSPPKETPAAETDKASL